MSAMSTVTNQEDLPAEVCDNVGDKVTASSTSKPDRTNCVLATEKPLATHICHSKITGDCHVFTSDQFNYLRELEERFTNTEKPSYSPINWNERKEALNAVSNYTKACKDSFNTVSVSPIAMANILKLIQQHGPGESELAEDSAALDCAEKFVTSNLNNYDMSLSRTAG